MTDHQLSTRDLAERSDSDEVDSSRESQVPTHDTNALNATTNPDSGTEGTESDASLTRPAAADSATGPAADTDVALPGSEADDTRTEQTRSVDTEYEPLFANEQSEHFTSRWQEIQTSFVDQPREAVAEADTLVADLMQRLASSFSQERERLEAQWDRGDDVSTEDLRVALTRYRSFFDRLLSA
jgi:hypothetical protein